MPPRLTHDITEKDTNFFRRNKARSGPGAARAWIQVSARQRGIPLLDSVFPARAENPNRRHRLRHAPDLELATGR